MKMSVVLQIYHSSKAKKVTQLKLTHLHAFAVALPDIPRKSSKDDDRKNEEKRLSLSDTKRRCVFCQQRSCSDPEHRDEKHLFEKTAVIDDEQTRNDEIMVHL